MGISRVMIESARAGAPQVILPQQYDQFYWAQRIHDLGIGASPAPGVTAADSLKIALERVLKPHVAARAKSIAAQVRADGALVAARAIGSM